MRLLLLVIIILIILFMVYFYKNHILCGKGGKPKHKQAPVFRGGYVPITRRRAVAPVAAVVPSARVATIWSDSDSDSDCEEEEETTGIFADQIRRRKLAQQAGIFSEEPEGNLFTKTSLQIINQKVDEEAGLFGSLFQTEKSLNMKNYYLRQNAEDNEFYNPDDVEAIIALGGATDNFGERTMVSRAEDESRDVVMSQIHSRIREQAGMTTEGVSNNVDANGITQVQVVSKDMLGGRAPASADLKKLAYEADNPAVAALMSTFAARDVEFRKSVAGDSFGSMVDQAPIASDYY